jgi:hypothetical protein
MLTWKRPGRRFFFAMMSRSTRAIARVGAERRCAGYWCVRACDSRLEGFARTSHLGLRGQKQPTQIGSNPGGLGG